MARHGGCGNCGGSFQHVSEGNNTGSGCIVAILGLFLAPFLIGIPIIIVGLVLMAGRRHFRECLGCGARVTTGAPRTPLIAYVIVAALIAGAAGLSGLIAPVARRDEIQAKQQQERRQRNRQALAAAERKVRVTRGEEIRAAQDRYTEAQLIVSGATGTEWPEFIEQLEIASERLREAREVLLQTEAGEREGGALLAAVDEMAGQVSGRLAAVGLPKVKPGRIYVFIEEARAP